LRLEATPQSNRAEFTGTDRGRQNNAARRRARQPADAFVRPIRQLAPHDTVLKPVPGASWQNREAMRPKKTILCIDDNEQILSVRTFLLETRGYRVIALTNPQDALDIISHSLPGTLDLLLCDLLMPKMDGNELVRRAKQLHPSLPAMIVSGTISAYDRAGRADVFLPKGACSPAEMLERIRILVARKRGPRKMTLPAPEAPTYNAAATA
jgi:CheY-like chemotaxis protein